MRVILFLIGFITPSLYNCAYTQSKNVNTFQRVVVPDSITLKLEEAYNRNAKHVNAGKNVFNLANRKDFVFKDGFFSFQGQGPHFPRRIFISNKGNIYIFENEGAFNPKGVLQEFDKCIDILQLTDKQIVRYIKILAEYLEHEEGKTYGEEIKK